jgi:5-methylcytosine-specific restriction endonuclease McrA
MTKNPGAQKIITKYLQDHGVGHVFDIPELEKVVLRVQTGTEIDPCPTCGQLPDEFKRTEVDRRLRELRKYGWKIFSHYEDESLNSNQYKLIEIGQWVWHSGWSSSKGVASKIKEKVFKRDDYKCVECGLGPYDTYEDGTKVRLTVGRILPGSKGGAYKMNNCRTECSRHNEPKTDKYFVEGI